MPTHDGPGYDPPARQTQITSQAVTKYYEPWVSEGNDNAQHTTLFSQIMTMTMAQGLRHQTQPKFFFVLAPVRYRLARNGQDTLS